MGEEEEELSIKFLILNHLKVLSKGELRGSLVVTLRRTVRSFYCFSFHNTNFAYFLSVMASLS